MSGTDESKPLETAPSPGADSEGDSDGGRAISPVIGTVLMVVLTVLLASVVSAGLLPTRDRLEEPEFGVTETASGTPWIGDLGGLVQPSDDTAGANDVRYRVNFTIADGSDTIGNSLNSVELRTTDSSPDMFSATSQSSLEQAYVDTDGDGDVDRDISDDVDSWQVSDGGSSVKVGFGGEYTAQADHSIVITFEGVDNPETAGTYTLEAQTSGDGNWQQGTIEIFES